MAKRRFRSRGKFSKLRRRRPGTKRLKRFVKRVVRTMSETKYAFKTNVFDNLNENFTIEELTPSFPQGVTKNTRIGNKIRYKYLQFRCFLSNRDGNAAGAVSYQSWRVMLFWLRNPLTTPITALDVLDTQSILSSIKNENVRIVMDKTMTLSNSQDFGQAGYPQRVFIKKKFPIHQNVLFRSNTESLPLDIHDKLYMLVLSGSNNVGESVLNVNWFIRMSFFDL